MEYDALRRGVAEFVGTFALIFVGMGSIAFVGPAGLVGVALAHGLTIAIMASAVGHISGGALQPGGDLRLSRDAADRAVARRASTGSRSSRAPSSARSRCGRPSPSEANLDSGVPVLHPTIGAGSGLMLEAILTFFLVWVIFATAADPGGAFKSIAGLAIGLTITIDILAAGPLTGAAMNPARALGPELVQNVWDDFWVYIVGPGCRRRRRRARVRLALPAGGSACPSSAPRRPGSTSRAPATPLCPRPGLSCLLDLRS